MVNNQLKISERIFGLDLMRAMAILMVLSSHVLWNYPQTNYLIVQILTLFGFWGVEIFFVLSGFLIGKILYNSFLKEDFTIKSVFYFLQRRWFRTLPTYFLVLIINVLIVYFLNVNANGMLYYFFFLQNFHTTMLPFFPESWSLSVEEFAYLFTPFVLLLSTFFVTATNKSKKFLRVIIFLIGIFTLTKIVYYFNTPNTTLLQWNVSLKAVVIYRIDAILYGVLASWLSINYSGIWSKLKYNLAFLSCILLVLMYVGVGYFRITIKEYPFFWNVLYLPFTSIIFLLFLPLLSQWKSTKKWILIPVTFVSTVSYSVYLLHYSVILQLMREFFPPELYSISNLHSYTFIYLVITFILSWFLYRFYEKPMTNLRK